MNREQTAAFVAESAGLPEAAARMEAERYARGPLQAVTYFAGARAFLDMAEAGQKDGIADTDFHDRLLSFGPVPPRAIVRALSAT